jgi:hypothetical protein
MAMRSSALRPILLRPLSGSGVHRYCRNLSTTDSPQVDKLQDRLWRQWEENSGQRELDELKLAVQQASTKFDQTVDTVASCRTTVEDNQKAHDDAHKQHANLMMRREQWDSTDAASFIDYTSKEVNSRQALTEARNALRRSEADASRCQRDYMDIMRQRYHEEQMWQDKWRMLGTFGTWSLIGLNSIVFLGSQFFHQRREVNRLKAIEDLILDNLKLMQDTVSEAAVTKTSATGENSKKSEEAIQIEKETLTTQPSKEQQPVDRNWMKVIKERDYDTAKRRVQDLVKDVDGPSVALGAATSATLMIIAVLATSRR